MNINGTLRRLTLVAGTIFFTSMLAFGCSRKKEECPEPTAVKKENNGQNAKTAASTASSDWCRACVMGPKGWVSCQLVHALKGEDREKTRQRSKESACLDAGFEKGVCPQEAVASLACSGDSSPKDNAEQMGEALQKIFMNSKGFGKSAKSESSASSPDSSKDSKKTNQ